MNKSSYRLVWFIPALVGCPLMVGSTGEDREKQCKTTFWGDVDCKTTFWGDVDSQTSRYLQRRPTPSFASDEVESSPFLRSEYSRVLWRFLRQPIQVRANRKQRLGTPRCFARHRNCFTPRYPVLRRRMGRAVRTVQVSGPGFGLGAVPSVAAPFGAREASTDPLTSTPSCGTPAEPSPDHPRSSPRTHRSGGRRRRH